MMPTDLYDMHRGQVFVKKLPLPGPAGWRTTTFKVTFKAGTAAVETSQKQPNAEGSVEWTQPLEIPVSVGGQALVATIVSRESRTGPWSFVTGCQFEAFPEQACRLVWQHPSDAAGAGPNFCAELETCLQRDKSQGVSGPTPTFGVETHKGVLCHPSATSSTGVDKSLTAWALTHSSGSAACSRGGVEDLKCATGFGALFTVQARGGHTRSASLNSYFKQRSSSFKRRVGFSAEARDSAFSILSPTEERAPNISQSAFLTSSIAAPGWVEHAASVQQEKPSVNISREVDGEPSIPWSLARTSSTMSHVTGAPSGSTIETQLAPMDGYCANLALVRQKEGPTSAAGDTTRVGGSRGVTVFDRIRQCVSAKPDAASIRSDMFVPRRGTDPLSPPPPPGEDVVLPVRTKEQPRGVGLRPLSEDGNAKVSPTHSLLSAPTEAVSSITPHPQSGSADKESPPSPVDEQASLDKPAHTSSTLGQAHLENETAPAKRSVLYYHPDALGSTRKDGADKLLTTEFTRIPTNCTTQQATRLLKNPEDQLEATAEALASPVASAARSPSRATAESGPLSPTRVAEDLERFRVLYAADPVYVPSISPRSVCAGSHFQLRVSTDMLQVLDGVFGAASREAEIKTRVPGERSTARARRVTAKLVLPEHVFNVLGPSTYASDKAARTPGDKKELPENLPKGFDQSMTNPNKAPHYPPSVQDFLWNGNVQDATFRVECLPDAPVGAVECSACITKGSIVTRVSFEIEVAETGQKATCGDPAAVEGLDTTSEEVKDNTAVGEASVPTISENVPARGIRAYPPAPVLLAGRVDPGPGVHESKEHGFRLTVQEGSLLSAIGPITVQEFAKVVKCEDDSQDYLVKIVVDCQPSGTKFSEIPLFMDFRVKDTSPAKISESFQVLVRKDETEGWRKVESEVRVDEWGTYMRAAVSDFCLFTCGSEIHPADPARLEDSEETGMIEVQNATDVELFFVLVPVLFDSDRTSRVTYTGNIGFGAVGVTVQAGVSSGHEGVEKCHMLPAGFTPDDVSVAPGGKFYFYPPPQSSEGKLLIATISEESPAGLYVKVVVLHGKFITPTGRRRVILPIFLQGKSRISARLGPDDVPVEMVMIMAGLGSKTTSPTEALSPEGPLCTAASAPAASVAPPPAVSPAAPPPATYSRRGIMKRCAIS